MLRRYYEKASKKRMVREFHNQYLQRHGWFESIRTMDSVDRNGPIPWFTYPALSSLERLINKKQRVFEFGAGNSTLWWAKMVSEVVAVEHDENWARHVQNQIHTNVEIHCMPMNVKVEDVESDLVDLFFKKGLEPALGDNQERNLRAGLVTIPFAGYASKLLTYPRHYFDIVVVDGMARVLCAWLATKWINQSGFIIFDNSDRAEYDSAYKILREEGFTRIDFWGPGPINPYEWCTSIFTKSLSMFDI